MFCIQPTALCCVNSDKHRCIYLTGRGVLDSRSVLAGNTLQAKCSGMCQQRKVTSNLFNLLTCQQRSGWALIGASKQCVGHLDCTICHLSGEHKGRALLYCWLRPLVTVQHNSNINQTVQFSLPFIYLKSHNKGVKCVWEMLSHSAPPSLLYSGKHTQCWDVQ